MTPEAVVKKAIRKILDEYKAWHCMPVGSGYGRSGILDIIACFHGVFIAIETKAGKGKTTALQDREIERIRKAGGYALVVNEENTEEVRELLEEIKRNPQI